MSVIFKETIRLLYFPLRLIHMKNNNFGSVLQKYCRNFHCNSKLYIKMYMEHENRHAYNIMENKGYVKNIIVHNTVQTLSILSKEQFDKLMEENWSKKTPAELFEVFPLLGEYSSQNGMCISNKIFDSYIDSLTDNLKQASDRELQTIFYSLLKWPETESIRTRNFIEVWVALDDECLNRLKIWSFDEILDFLSLFYLLNVTRYSDFSKKSLQKMTSKSKQLTPNQLVQALFFIGIMRKSPIDIHNLELHLDKHFTHFSLDELAIMSMGFFKSKTPIRSPELMSKIVNQVIEHSKDVHEVSLAALLKVIRYSMKVHTGNIIYNMLDTLQHEVPRLSVMCNVHLALVGTATLTFHRECLERIAESTIQLISKNRIKDLERLVLTYGTFNFVPNTNKSFLQTILDELRKPERLLELERYGRSFACCVAYLGYLNVYPIDLMNKVLSTEFLEKTYGKQVLSYGREVLTIHNTAKIFCPNANMNRLSDKSAVILAKHYTDYVPSLDFKKQYNITEKMMLDVMTKLQECRGGKEYVVGEHIVPHYQRGDVIVCDDQMGQPVKVQEHFSSSQFGHLRRPPNNNNWVVLIIAGRNSIIRNTDSPTGPFQAKIKEIKALGFHAALVPWSIYSSLQSEKAKTDFLNDLIKNAIKNSNVE